jgi:hypothetical protein
MDTSDRFLRFAAECEVMAKFTRSRENKEVWNGLAQRWLKCAELMGQENSMVHQRNSERRHRGAVHSSTH